jgi:ABC-2 type transport system ATP-binding protein
MSSATDAERAVGLLSVAQAEREGSRIRVPSTEGPRSLMEMLRTLDAGGLYPSSLTVREPSLDDVFLRLTGHHAEPVAEPETEQPVPVGGAA